MIKSLLLISFCKSKRLNRLLILFFPFLLNAIATNNIDAEVQWDSIYANTPYIVTISVTHDSNDKIDPSSFTANNKKISPIFDRDVKISVSSPLEISIYTLEMPGLPQGLHVLPTFGVKIKNQIYTSIPTGFEVKSGTPAASKGPFLKLQTVFTGKPPIYPGERFFVGYRYLYNISVELSEEKLPLLEAKGFKRIGDKQIETGEENGVSITQVIQKVEAVLPGAFPFEASLIVGLSNKISLRSEIPPFEIKVLPFPEEGKPASFRGGIGQYTFQAKLIGSNQVQVGDKIQLQLIVTGDGELEQLLAPDLCCQPGFSGFFKQSDLPPETSINGKTKTFLVELFVENAEATQIPPIEFSFFNSSTGKYEKKMSEAIPIKVTKEVFPSIPSESIPSISTSKALLSIDSFDSFPISIPLLAVIGIGLLALQGHVQ